MKKTIFLPVLLMLLFAAGHGDIMRGRAEADNAGKEAKSGMYLRITAEGRTLIARLNESAASRAFWSRLPLTLPMTNLYGRQMCFHFGYGGLPSGGSKKQGYKAGDISYWPPRGSLIILYKQTGALFDHLTLGHITGDVSFFDGVEDTDVTFEKADET